MDAYGINAVGLNLYVNVDQSRPVEHHRDLTTFELAEYRPPEALSCDLQRWIGRI